MNKLVTFGVIPTSPEIGYGYIKLKNHLEIRLEGFDIESFIEKPNKETAERLIEDNRYTWNSGMFMFKAKEIIKEINKFSPKILLCCKKAINKK